MECKRKECGGKEARSIDTGIVRRMRDERNKEERGRDWRKTKGGEIAGEVSGKGGTGE